MSAVQLAPVGTTEKTTKKAKIDHPNKDESSTSPPASACAPPAIEPSSSANSISKSGASKDNESKLEAEPPVPPSKSVNGAALSSTAATAPSSLFPPPVTKIPASTTPAVAPPVLLPTAAILSPPPLPLPRPPMPMMSSPMTPARTPGGVNSSAPSTPAGPVIRVLQTEITRHDVLLGRGGGTNKHAGNIAFRNYVCEHQPAYVQSRKRDKSTIAKAIVARIRSMNGRFLKVEGENTSGDPSATVWIDVGDKRATEKTSQALREGLSGKMRDIVNQSGKGLKDLKETGVVSKKGEVSDGMAGVGVSRPAAATASAGAGAASATVPVPAAAAAIPNETPTDQVIKEEDEVVKSAPTIKTQTEKENGETTPAGPTSEKCSDNKSKDDDASESVAI